MEVPFKKMGEKIILQLQGWSVFVEDMTAEECIR